MELTKVLSDEHRVIEVVLTCLERIADQALVMQRLDRENAGQAIEFIRNFADKCHHGKEEEHLFAALVNKGMPTDSGPIAQMIYEHELGRGLVGSMAENVEPASAGELIAVENFAANAREYVQLLRAHIMKEDNALFPLAERVLSSDEKNHLIDEFGHVESEQIGRGTHARYIKIAVELAARCGVSCAGIECETCGCGH